MFRFKYTNMANINMVDKTVPGQSIISTQLFTTDIRNAGIQMQDNIDRCSLVLSLCEN